MIEKLDVMKDTRNVIDKDGIVHTVANFTAIDKINELVDAINELQVAKDVMFNRIDILNNAICDIRNTTENVQPDAESRQENVQVDEIEQAEKWIGKLCWFSQIYECHQHIAILKRISESGLYVTDDGELHYAYCEPVKPDDDIIYQGGNNE